MALLAFIGCDGVPQADMGQNPTRDVLPSGVEVVHYPSLTSSPSILTEDLRIGVLDGAPPYVFGDIRGIEAGSDGTIYVLDFQAAELRAFSPQGDFVRTVARRGEGPGELSQANGMILSGDSILWVQDHRKGRMLGLSPSGGELGREPMTVTSYGYIWSGTVDAAGTFWKPSYASDAEPVFPPELGLTQATSRRFWKSYDTERQAYDSVYVGGSTFRSYVSQNPRGFTHWAIPFSAAPVSVVDPSGGFWESEGSSYRIARLSEQGDTTLILEAAVTRFPVTDEDRSDFVDDVVERTPEQRAAAEAVADAMPELKPAIDQMLFDDQGRLWVRRTRGSDDDPTRYDAFERDGEYRGSVVLGFEVTPYLPPRVRGENLYALVADSLGVQSVVRAPLPAMLR